MEKVNILLVEDNPEHQKLLCHVLEDNRPFVKIVVAGTGKQCKDILKKEDFDCIVMDHNLPDMNGDQLLLELSDRENRTGRKFCPILSISSSKKQDIVISNIRNGSVDFVPKTQAIEPNVLWERIQNALRDRKNQKMERNRMEKRRRELVRMAEMDALTGLYNRRYFQRQLKRGNYARDRRRYISCAMIDIDHFKQINDSYGHSTGDRVLQSISRTIRQNLSGGDAAIRWGGEEFVVFLASTELTRAWIWAENLRKQIEKKSFECGDEDFHVTASIGLTSLETKKVGPDTIETIDQAMYQAKMFGRNRVCTADMVAYMNILRDITAKPGSVLEKRRLFLETIQSQLGPTQKMHLTMHSQRVTEIAMDLARRKGFSERKLAWTYQAGLLHDIGKCVIPEALLAKLTPLSREEFGIINMHSGFGAKIAEALGAEKWVCSAIEHHHLPYEQMRHYPANFDGAKLLCLADALATMTGGRPYRKAINHKQAIDELNRFAGKQFDPQWVKLSEQSTAESNAKHSVSA